MTYKIFQGDCRDVVALLLPDASVDAIVTDPPYGLGFMGKGWDHGVPGVEFWAEALRVAKPGAHLLAFGGTRTFHRLVCAIEDAGFEVRDTIMWLYGSGFPKSKNLDGEWDGWGTALKPAHEPIVVARKPLAGTVEANVQEYGTGALNIDGCRVPAEGRPLRVGENDPRKFSGDFKQGSRCEGTTTAGRWPANVIHDGSDEVLGAFPDAPGQIAKARTDGEGKTNAIYGKLNHVRGTSVDPRGDTGSAARFFYCAKASRKDRNEGCEALPEKPLLWSSGTQSPGTFQAEGTKKAAQNNHPTVKPTELMRYLCRLVTPPRGVVLDPFMGSGSTGKAAVLEGFDFIGVELEAPYVEIARARIGAAA